MRDINKKEIVYCPKQVGSEKEPSWCEKFCPFFGGRKEDKIDCLFNSSISNHNFHITEIKSEDPITEKETIYKLKSVLDDPEKYEDYKINDDPCKFCCFLKTLPNGKDYCELRYGTEDPSIISCYDNEYWEIVE